MSNFDNSKHILKSEIMQLAARSQEKQEEVTRLLQEIEELKLIALEIQEAIKKLSE